jgi:hypothetical protein
MVAHRLRRHARGTALGDLGFPRLRGLCRQYRLVSRESSYASRKPREYRNPRYPYQEQCRYYGYDGYQRGVLGRWLGLGAAGTCARPRVFHRIGLVTSAGNQRKSNQEKTMATKANFTPDEWKAILGSPMLAGMASGLWGTMKEGMARGLCGAGSHGHWAREVHYTNSRPAAGWPGGETRQSTWRHESWRATRWRIARSCR